MARPEYVFGDVHRSQPRPARSHSNVAASLAERAKVADLAGVRTGGPETMVVSGAVKSFVHERT